MEPSSLNRSVAGAVPLATMSVAPSSTTTTRSIAAGTAPTGTIPLAAASAGYPSTSGSGDAGSRTLQSLVRQWPWMQQWLAQLLSPPSDPVAPPPPSTPTPAIGLSSTNLSFTGVQGGTSPATQTVTISNTGGGTLSWTASNNAAWLTLSPASGTGNGAVTLTATTGTLTTGSYSGTVTMSATGASSVTVPVTFTVTTAPLPPAIGASPTSLSFTAQAGANPAAQTLTISNTGGGTLSWSASNNAAWLTLSPASGTGNGAVTLTATTGTLTTGSYSGTVTMSAPNATTVTVPVSFTVTAAPVPPAIGASPTSFSFTAQQAGSNPASQTVSISNTGGGTLSWSASNNAAWLTLSPASGTGNGAMTLTATTGTLTAGSYSGTMTMSAIGASPVTVPVSFTVAAAPVPPAIGASPTSLSFAATQGGTNPATQTLNISNTGGGTLTWTASETASWLTLSTTGSTGNGTVTLTAATAGLPVSTQNATITLSAAGAATVSVPVSFTITAAPTPTIGLSSTNLSFTGVQGGTSPATQTVTISNNGAGTLSWTGSGSNSWLSVSPASGSVAAGSSNTLSVSASTTGLAGGTVSAPIMISASGATNTPQTITASLTVTAQPALGLSPTTFSFTATQGAANPAPNTLNVTNPGTGTLTWSVTDNASWLTLTPASGTTTTGTSPVTLSVNTLGLPAGPVTAAITVTAGTATNSPQTIPVTLTVSAPTTSSATLTWDPNTESDLAGYKVYRATASGAYGAPIATLTGNVTNYGDMGLQVGTTYFFVVTAYDTAGNESTVSNEVSKSIF